MLFRSIANYEGLKAAYNTIHKDEIMRKKDTYDLELQSKRNLCQEKIALLKKYKEEYYYLTVELERLKVAKAKMISAELFLNDKNFSKEFTNDDDPLNKLKSIVEEKIGLMRELVGGIVHIMHILQIYDDYGESIWQNLDLMTAVADIEEVGLIFKFSQLLMTLQEKFAAVIFTLLQRVSQLDAPKSALDDFKYAGCVVITANDYPQCKGEINKYLIKKRESSPLFTKYQIRSLAAYEHDDDLGKYIIAKDYTKLDQKFPLSNPADEIVPPTEEDVTEQVFDIRRHKTTRRIYNVPAPRPIPPKDYINEQSMITKRFCKGRVMAKIAREINLKNEKTEIVKNPIREPSQKKKINNLTLEVARAMKNKPQEIIDTATETFVTLDKIRRLNKERLQKEFEANQGMFPNFLCVILNMKKSRNNEAIGRIASKCSYFTQNDVGLRIPRYAQAKVASRLFGYSTEVIADFDGHVVNNIQRRVKNLNALTRLDEWPSMTTNAFGTFCSRVKDSSFNTTSMKSPSEERKVKIKLSPISNIRKSIKPKVDNQLISLSTMEGSTDKTKGNVQ